MKRRLRSSRKKLSKWRLLIFMLRCAGCCADLTAFSLIRKKAPDLNLDAFDVGAERIQFFINSLVPAVDVIDSVDFCNAVGGESC